MPGDVVVLEALDVVPAPAREEVPRAVVVAHMVEAEPAPGAEVIGRPRGAVVGVTVAVGMLAHANRRLLRLAVCSPFRCMAPFHERTMPLRPERSKAASGDKSMTNLAERRVGRPL